MWLRWYELEELLYPQPAGLSSAPRPLGGRMALEVQTLMQTTYRVELRDGTHVEAVSLEAAREVIAGHPDARCVPVIRYQACPDHRGYEVGNCPACPGRRTGQ